LIEVNAAASAAGVPLTVLPLDANLGDSWLQDQFQIVVTTTRERTLPIVIHLPRVAHSAVLVPGTPNLRSFVDAHFPSNDIGVFKDLWAINLTIGDGTTSVDLSVTESYPVFVALTKVVDLLQRILGAIAERSPG